MTTSEEREAFEKWAEPLVANIVRMVEDMDDTDMIRAAVWSLALASRTAAREEPVAFDLCEEACEAERVRADETGEPTDIAYNLAIDHCIDGIRAARAALAQQDADK
jgi:hypothetical protein